MNVAGSGKAHDHSKVLITMVESWILILLSFYTSGSQSWLKLDSFGGAFKKTTNAQTLHHINLIRTPHGRVLALVLL